MSTLKKEALLNITKEWNLLHDDTDRWKMLKEYSEYLVLILGDKTTGTEWSDSIVELMGVSWSVVQLYDFDEYIGVTQGVRDMLEGMSLNYRFSTNP